MKTIKDVTKTIHDNEDALKKLQVKALFVFGSVARGEETKDSDIDFLVEFAKPVGMFEFLEVKYFLEDILKSKIDLATERALHPELKNKILKEALRVA